MHIGFRALGGSIGGILLGCLLTCTAFAEPSLTIYNQNFAVVRDTVSLDLKSGTNQVRFSGVTADLEPSSVILRDPAGKNQFQVLEQNFRGDPISQGMLLALNEGKTIAFESLNQQGGETKRELVRGRIIRSGYSSPRGQNYGGYDGSGLQPIIEVNGQLRFSLPGEPIFPALADNTVLMPTLVWVIESAAPARFDAELSYVTSEMSWAADYNLALPESGNTLDLVGWVTMDNQSGKSFEQARIALMAGDVSKIQNPSLGRSLSFIGSGGGGGGRPAATEKSFDEYHLYTLPRPATLLDREKKQVEFVHAAGVKSTTAYIYDGASLDQDQNWNPQAVNSQPDYGTHESKRIWVLREFANSEANHLGLPLPKGRVRVYRRNTDGQMEFTGENTIKHTPRDEAVRLYTGDAFDLVGERKQTDFQTSPGGGIGPIDPTTGLPSGRSVSDTAQYIDESFEITLRNHKKEPVEVRVVEHLYRWNNWEIKETSDIYKKTDAQTIEFRVRVKPDEERKVTYKVHYFW